ncbi:MAG: bacterioferritin [Acidimicrobiia bacterium]
MQGDAEIIDFLNEALTNELTSVNQYFLDAKMLANWGYARLAEKYHSESIDEMKDADSLIERILYLDGMPNLQRLSALHIGENPVEKIGAALALETTSIERLNRGIALCVSKGDNGTRELLEQILAGEEEFADWLETQQELVSQLGDSHYLAQQIRD